MRATSPKPLFRPGEPFTWNLPSVYSRSASLASRRWAAIFLPFSLIFWMEAWTAAPPTAVDRLP